MAKEDKKNPNIAEEEQKKGFFSKIGSMFKKLFSGIRDFVVGLFYRGNRENENNQETPVNNSPVKPPKSERNEKPEAEQEVEQEIQNEKDTLEQEGIEENPNLSEGQIYTNQLSEQYINLLKEAYKNPNETQQAFFACGNDYITIAAKKIEVPNLEDPEKEPNVEIDLVVMFNDKVLYNRETNEETYELSETGTFKTPREAIVKIIDTALESGINEIQPISEQKMIEMIKDFSPFDKHLTVEPEIPEDKNEVTMGDHVLEDKQIEEVETSSDEIENDEVTNAEIDTSDVGELEL